jgi:tRNA threonylcarbamoyladenosine biosynthesis protein TsaB
MINILALETTGKYGSAAVIKEDGSVYCASSETEMNHLKDIITISDEAVKAAGITKKDLTHVAASAGPGSFTGIRIGVTTARTLGQMLGIPCIAVSSLESMARRVLSQAIAAEALYVVPVINARRHQTYAGAWQAVFTSDGEKQSIVSEMPEKQYMIEDLLAALTEKAEEKGAKVFFTGDGIDAYEDIIRDAFAAKGISDLLILADENIRYQSADSAARIALAKALKGDILTYERLLPEYMRLSEAEQRLREGTLSDKIKKAR